MIYFKHNLDTRQVRFLDSRAYGTGDGMWYPSVTTILGIIDKGVQFREWLMNTGRNADYITTKAMEQGSLVHGLVERFLINSDSSINCVTYDAEGKETHSFSKEAWGMLARFVEFYKKVKPELIAVEQSLSDPDLGFGGTIDLIAKFNGLTWLLDIKTGSYLYDEYDLQLSAYAIMWNKIFPDYKIDKIAVIHLDAQTRTEGKGDAVQGRGWKLAVIGDEEKYTKDFSLFQNVFNVWRWRNPTWKPSFLELPDHFNRLEIDNGE